MILKAASNIFKPKNHQPIRNFIDPSCNTTVLVPMVTQNTGRGERSSDIYSRLLSERIVCLMGTIHDAMSSLIIAQLLFLQSESNHKPIHLYINSPGGSVTAGLGIYDTIQYILPPVVTWCVGQACSMASLILAAGTPGMRNSLPNSRIMIHQPSGGAQGQATDILIHAAEIIKLKNQINNLYVKHTGLPLDRIESHIERDHFMDPLEAQRFGLIDNVLLSAPKLVERKGDKKDPDKGKDKDKGKTDEKVKAAEEKKSPQPAIAPVQFDPKQTPADKK